MKPDNIIKFILALLLLLCLLKLPYGFYMLLRVLFTVGFAILAIRANKDKKQTEVTIYVILAILFQPLLKIPLGRTIWNTVDVIVAIGLIIEILKSLKKEKETVESIPTSALKKR